MCKLKNTTGADSEEQIFTQETSDPFLTEIELTDTSPAFTESYLQSFRQPLPEDQSEAQLQDRLSTGWLTWGKTMEVSRMTGWDEHEVYIDKDCKSGIKRIEPVVDSPEFWQTVSSYRSTVS